MVMFGIGSILPFSAMTTAIEFFNKHFDDYQPEFTYAFAMTFPQIIVQLITITY